MQQMEERNIASQSNEMPLDFLLRRMRDPAFSPTERFLAARAAAPFCHPALQAVAHRHLDASGRPLAPKVTVTVHRAPPEAPRLGHDGPKGGDDAKQIGKWKGLNRSHKSKRSASGAQLAHALSTSHCLFTDWRPTA
jgi:hypothetical protein